MASGDRGTTRPKPAEGTVPALFLTLTGACRHDLSSVVAALACLRERFAARWATGHGCGSSVACGAGEAGTEREKVSGEFRGLVHLELAAGEDKAECQPFQRVGVSFQSAGPLTGRGDVTGGAAQPGAPHLRPGRARWRWPGKWGRGSRACRRRQAPASAGRSRGGVRVPVGCRSRIRSVRKIRQSWRSLS